MHHWPAFGLASAPICDDAASPSTQDGQKALIGHDARFMKLPARRAAVENASMTEPAFSAAAEDRFATLETVPASGASTGPSFSLRKLKPYAFGIGYAVFAVSTAAASFLLLAASIRPH
jgi:hypothetical protein